MIKSLFILLLMSATQIFGNQSTTATDDKPNETAIIENPNCTLPDGRTGVCVPYYNCNITDKSKYYDYSENNCTSYIDVCCTSDDEAILKPIFVKEKEFQLVNHTGCGWAYPDGVTSEIREYITRGKSRYGEFPWIVAVISFEPIFKDDPESPRGNIYIGAGSLIHPNVALTAASYVVDIKSVKIRAGVWDSKMTDELYPVQNRDVASVEIHKDFNKAKSMYNIAILFVAKAFEEAPNVKVACLPPPNYVQKDGTSCYGIGWGKELIGRRKRFDEILKKIEMPFIKREDCQETLRKNLNDSDYQLPSSVLCAGGDTEKVACQNHGLSTLSCPIESQKDRYVQSGFTTIPLNVDCGSGTNPGLYTDVSAVREWIDGKVVEKGYDPKTYTY